jgi:hypothetical protein
MPGIGIGISSDSSAAGFELLSRPGAHRVRQAGRERAGSGLSYSIASRVDRIDKASTGQAHLGSKNLRRKATPVQTEGKTDGNKDRTGYSKHDARCD